MGRGVAKPTVSSRPAWKRGPGRPRTSARLKLSHRFTILLDEAGMELIERLRDHGIEPAEFARETLISAAAARLAGVPVAGVR